MKTIEQVLEGVTAGGKWMAYGVYLCENDKDDEIVAAFSPDSPASIARIRNAAYAARACGTWPELVRALQRIASMEAFDEPRAVTKQDLELIKRIKLAEAAVRLALADDPPEPPPHKLMPAEIME